jgi:HIRAN domain
MKRTDFLKTLLGSIAIGKLPVSITKDFRKIYLLQCFVAGFRHYEGMNLLETMEEGDLLALVREPENEFDNCAIALHWQDKKIGFIPAAINEMLSYLLDANALSLFAVITNLEKNSQPWENVAIAVYFIQEADKKLPAHASYLTRIEAPHYRTLSERKNATRNGKDPTLEKLFENNNRVINLDKIPDEQKEAKVFFEENYSKYPVSIDRIGKFVRVIDDGIFMYMSDISEEIQTLKNEKGESFMEFFLVGKKDTL